MDMIFCQTFKKPINYIIFTSASALVFSKVVLKYNIYNAYTDTIIVLILIVLLLLDNKDHCFKCFTFIATDYLGRAVDSIMCLLFFTVYHL